MAKLHNRAAGWYSGYTDKLQSANPAIAPRLSSAYGNHHSTNTTLFRWVHVGCDALALILAWFVTFRVRLGLNGIMPVSLSLNDLRAAAPSLKGMLLLWLIAAVWLRIYRAQSRASFSVAIVSTVESVATMSTLATVLIFFSRAIGIGESRSFVPIFALVSLTFLIPSFYLALFLTRALEPQSLFSRRVAVVGEVEETADLIESIRNTARHRDTLLGLIVPDSANRQHSTNGLPVLGTIRQLAELINRERIDRLVMASNRLPCGEFGELELITSRMGVTVSCPVGSSRASGARLRLAEDYGLSLINFESSFSHEDGAEKRQVDLIVSIVLLVLFSPLLALLCILIKMTSPGPIFYKSLRVGRGGRYFIFWKFRSMYYGTSRAHMQSHNEQDGHLFKVRNDPRVTPLGRFMRRHSLDELPQLFNVIKGEMSIVGPRPLPVEDLDADGFSSEFAYWAEERARVRPGITGLWQTCGRSNLSFERMMDLDIEYLQTHSSILDLKIMLATPIVMFSGRGAY